MWMQVRISRRDFSVATGTAALGLLTSQWPSLPTACAKEPEGRLLLSVPLTHADWMFRPGAVWGTQGVRSMLDTCKATGWTRIYWRVFNGGLAVYRSKLMDPEGKWEEDNYHSHYGNIAVVKKAESFDYSQLDTLAEAVRYGHQIGLEIYAWASINEDDHAWGSRSRFAKAHPEYRWRKRSGTFYHSQMSFAFPDVIRYKLALIEELIDGYPIDGLFLDWIRTGDVRDEPQTDAQGVADHGYEQPTIDGFKKHYGVDPVNLPNGDDRWVRYRAQPHTDFMRQVRTLTKNKRSKSLPISVLVAHPWMYRGEKHKIDGSLRGLLLDVAAWADEGLIDEAVPAGYYLDGGDAERAYQAIKEETRGKVPIAFYGWVPRSKQQFLADVQAAQRVGAQHILLWEADYIDDLDPRVKKEVQDVVRSRAKTF
jgi:uncharacterized lipoprotein YddW (UPF0748 family)